MNECIKANHHYLNFDDSIRYCINGDDCQLTLWIASIFFTRFYCHFFLLSNIKKKKNEKLSHFNHKELYIFVISIVNVDNVQMILR